MIADRASRVYRIRFGEGGWPCLATLLFMRERFPFFILHWIERSFPKNDKWRLENGE
jgi:hypothetical protein